MTPELLLSKAINTLNRWNEDLYEEDEAVKLMYSANVNILEYALMHVDQRKTPAVRNAIALAYAILGMEEKV
jgi:hypothetical protein